MRNSVPEAVGCAERTVAGGEGGGNRGERNRRRGYSGQSEWEGWQRAATR